MMMTASIITEPYLEEQAQVERRLREIMDAARAQDVGLHRSYHLCGPKFSKFDDCEPLDRLDADMTHRTEAELLAGVKKFDPMVNDLKVDVFGPTAVATFTLHYDVTTNEEEQFSLACRTTMVFVNDRSDWKIAHKHLSGFYSNV